MAERREPPRRDSETGGEQPEIKPVVDLLASILSEVQKQVQSKTPPSLQGMAQVAVDEFTEIGAALALQALPSPTITLKAEPVSVDTGGTTTLSWSSTDARTVLIKKIVGDVTSVFVEAANGSRNFTVSARTQFMATAQGFCGSATDSATVTVVVME